LTRNRTDGSLVRLITPIPNKEGEAVADRRLKEYLGTFYQVGRMDDDGEDQAEGVDEEMALLALDLLARVIARRVDAPPLFPRLSRSDCRSHLRSGWPRDPPDPGS
jgi:hypothetical protein